MAYLAYAEIVGEEQRRMTQFMPARLIPIFSEIHATIHSGKERQRHGAIRYFIFLSLLLDGFLFFFERRLW